MKLIKRLKNLWFLSGLEFKDKLVLEDGKLVIKEKRMAKVVPEKSDLDELLEELKEDGSSTK